LGETSYVGEVGLDFSREGKATQEAQLRAFREVARCIAECGPRFVSIHSRGAEEAVLAVLNEYRIESAVLHWFSGSLPILERVLAAGHYLSVNPSMARSAKGQEILSRIPRDRMLTETDGPYTRERNRPRFPWDVEAVEQHLAKLWRDTAEGVRNQIWTNFRTQMNRLRQNRDGGLRVANRRPIE